MNHPIVSCVTFSQSLLGAVGGDDGALAEGDPGVVPEQEVQGQKGAEPDDRKADAARDGECSDRQAALIRSNSYNVYSTCGGCGSS
jgi:hypothetical protein